MSVAFRIADQILKVTDRSDATEAIVRKYDAFLNLLCAGPHAFQRDIIREALRYLVSPAYPDLEHLARDNWNRNPALAKRHETIDDLLRRMPLKDRKSASLDLATGAGKSFVMYGLAAIALAEGLVDRVLVLCPSLTIEDGLLEKFTALAGDSRLADIMTDLEAKVAIPAIKRGTETIQPGDICIENIHAVYGASGSSIADSFKDRGERTLVLNDEAHHIFSPDDSDDSATMKKWLQFLLSPDYGFRHLIHVTGTPYIGNDYFADVIQRFGLKQAIEAGVVKKPDYIKADTHRTHTWDRSYKIHQDHRKEFKGRLRPISIVVTADIARCVEAWRELVDFLVKKERISREEAERKAIWVTSGIPTAAEAKRRVTAVYGPRGEKDSPEKRRKENLTALKSVDDPASPVEWIVSVSMLTEGWDVKNVFQIVPHESKAFQSKLLIAQVLGRGLRVPPGFPGRPLVKVTNHEAWSEEISRLLDEVLEVENTLTMGYDPDREALVFPIHNLSYELEMTTEETKRERVKEIDVTLMPQSRKSTHWSTFSQSGLLAYEVTHDGLVDIDDAARLLRLFIRDKDETIAKEWPASRIKKLIERAIKRGGYEGGFLSAENFSLVKQAFGPLFRGVDRVHPRMGQAAKDLVTVDYRDVTPQSFSESRLREDGAIYHVAGKAPKLGRDEVPLWEQYSKWVKIARIDQSGMTPDALAIAGRIHEIEPGQFKTPANLHFASHAPERDFSRLLFANADLIESFIKMPDRGGYALPYSYKPSKTGKTHAVNENFNPDFFIRLKGSTDVLVVEVKQDDDDSRRNAAKLRDGTSHFKRLNSALERACKPWRYHFYFLSPEDFVAFFGRIKDGKFRGWKSSLMQTLSE